MASCALGSGLIILSFVMRFKAASLRKHHWQFNSTLGKSITNYISIVVLIVEYFVNDALRKELIIAPLVKSFKTDTSRRSPKQILTVLWVVPLDIAFLLLLCLKKYL